MWLRQVDKQTDQTDRQTDRGTERQTDRGTEKTDRQIGTVMLILDTLTMYVFISRG